MDTAKLLESVDALEALCDAAERGLIYCSCGRDFVTESTFRHHATSANRKDKARSDASISRRPLRQHEQAALDDLKCLGKAVKKKDCPACSAHVDKARDKALYELGQRDPIPAARDYIALTRALVARPCGFGDDGVAIRECGAEACSRCAVLSQLAVRRT